jgi:hypothetical protein
MSDSLPCNRQRHVVPTGAELAFAFRREDARCMLAAGALHSEIVNRHGSVVLKAALEPRTVGEILTRPAMVRPERRKRRNWLEGSRQNAQR